ncbi:MAG: hypothetical protein AAB336_06825 [Acidobacteriota bacterium]
MKMKLIILPLLICFLLCSACQSSSQSITKQTENIQTGSGQPSNLENVNASNTNLVSNSANSQTAESQTSQPKTVREFFNLLPQKYFTLEGCEPNKDKNCDKARKEYIKTFLEIEDNKNGYWKSGCDGAQSCLTMALFKRPDATYIVHLLTEFEMGEDSYFLEYKNGKWSDIGAKIVPNFSSKNTYIPPREGTTIEVFKKNFPEPSYSERGEKLYDLAWSNGKFSIKK